MSVDDSIRRGLQLLVQPVDDVESIVRDVSRRQERQRRARTMRRVSIAAASAAVLALGVWTATGLSSPPDTVVAAQPDGGAVGQASTVGPFVTVAASGVDGLAVTTTELQDARRGWLEHTITFENRSDVPRQLSLEQSAHVLSEAGRELAADDGCWYDVDYSAMSVVGIKCRAPHHSVTLEPGGTWSLRITLWRPADDPVVLEGGASRWTRAVRVTPDPAINPSSGLEGQIVITYRDLHRASRSDGSLNRSPASGQGSGAGAAR